MRAPSLNVLATLVMLFAAVIGLQAVHERRGAPGLPPGVSGNLLYLQSPEVARRAALSYKALVADVYWIRAVQHYGRTRLGLAPDKRYDLLYPLLDLTTSLDPRFDVAYRFGAIFLAEPSPGGAGRADQAIALLEKGLRAQPDKWQFAGDIGFVYYWWLHDYPHAAEWFQRARGMPGGPEWMAALSATVMAQGGNRASSRRLWQEILHNEEANYLQERARLRLAQLDALDQIDALRRIASRYEQQTGRPPRAWLTLIQAGLLRGTPVDPAGSPYLLDPATGAISLSGESPLNPLPDNEPAL